MRRALFASLAFVVAFSADACAATQQLGDDLGADAGTGHEGGATGLDGSNEGSSLDSGGDGSQNGDGSVTPGPSPRRIATGLEFTCAITSAGGAKCWGDDTFGELGNGSNNNPGGYTPGDVNNLTSGVAGIVARYDHACAWTISGAVSCWGQSVDGETGTSNDTSVASLVPSLGAGVMMVAAGDLHSCALLTGGTMKCWGSNANGQLGSGATDLGTHPTPLDVQISGVTAIATGQNHTCAVANGSVKCWGSDSADQIGPGLTADSPTPLDVAGTSGAIDVCATDNSSCALNGSGAVKCWGQAIGPYTFGTWTPAGLVSFVPGGQCHMCGIKTNGALACWGCNFDGEFGDGSNTGTGPSGPASLTFVSASGGATGSCGITIAGAAKCWGLNDNGQLGNTADFPQAYSPTDVTGW